MLRSLDTASENQSRHRIKPLIQFQNVDLRYGDRIVFGEASFSIPPGSFHFLTGVSGAGKSSLLKLMYLGARPYRGSISLFGRDTRNVQGDEIAAFRQKIGVVFQDGFLLNHLNVIDNVALPLRVKGENQHRARNQALKILDWVGLGDRATSSLSILSGGERQRVVIARAVIAKPALLLADEATGNVDDETASRIMFLFEEMNRAGTTIVFATHNQDLLTTFSYPYLHLEGGRLHQEKPLMQTPPQAPPHPTAEKSATVTVLKET